MEEFKHMTDKVSIKQISVIIKEVTQRFIPKDDKKSISD